MVQQSDRGQRTDLTDDLQWARAQSFPRFDAHLLIIDMINDFMDVPGARLPVDGALALVGRIAVLARCCAHVTILHDDHPDDDPEFQIYGVHSLAGSWGARGTPGLEWSDRECATTNGTRRVYPKTTYNGFSNPEFAAYARTLGLGHPVLVTGVATDICILQTTNGALEHGHTNIWVVSDCCAGLPPDLGGAGNMGHDRAIETLSSWEHVTVAPFQTLFEVFDRTPHEHPEA